MRVLVTGAAGLVGGALFRRLRADGVDVVGIDRVAGTRDGLEIVQCDVRDVHRLHEIVLRQKTTAIVHCGAYSGPMVGEDNPAEVIAVNVGGTANLLEVARVHAVERFVFCSSVSAVGPTAAPITEDVVLRPTTTYGASKAACEHLMAAYSHMFQLDTVALRLAAVWGPERTTICALGTMIKNAMVGQATRFEHGGAFPTQYVHIDDVVEALVLALKARNLSQPVYNITGGVFLPLSDVAAEVRKAFPQAAIEIGPGGDPMYDWQEEFDIGAARRDLGFSPRVGFQDGIGAFIEALQSRHAEEKR